LTTVISSKIRRALQVEQLPTATPTTESIGEISQADRLAAEDVEDRRADRKGRVELVPKLIHIVQIWTFGTLFILFWQGWTAKLQLFHLSDPVLIALLTTTMGNILGMLAIATSYFFSEKRISEKKA
jgi:hypothetical protein